MEEEVVECPNCNEVVPIEETVLTEHDGRICKECIKNGYGK